MAERFSDIEKPFVIHQPSLQERLREYPELKAKIDSMLAIIENAGGDVTKPKFRRDSRLMGRSSRMKTNRVYLKCLTSKTRPYLRLRD